MKKTAGTVFIILTAFLLTLSCKKDKPLPVAIVTSEVHGNIVTFDVVATDATVFEWDFGDGSAVSTEEKPEHIYPEYGKNYTVTLTVRGPGGQITVSHTVTIPPMTKMEMLTGGVSDADGKRWKLNSTEQSFIAEADPSFTILETVPGGTLTFLGYTTIYQDEVTFRSNGSYTMTPKGSGLPASQIYCTANNIPNLPPCPLAEQAGVTLMTPYTAPSGLTFALNESKNLTVEVTTDMINTSTITCNNVTTISFSSGGFLEFRDWLTEVVVLDLTPARMKVAYFVSRVPVDSPLIGKTTNVLIFIFDAVQ
jgi:PKD repeat protein